MGDVGLRFDGMGSISHAIGPLVDPGEMNFVGVPFVVTVRI
jgi:hypothetical protein